MMDQRLRALTDRYIRMLEEVDERKADLKEIELEAKATGYNLRQFKEWAKAEHADKVQKKVSDVEDAALYGAGLGHEIAIVPDNEKSKDWSGSNQGAAA